MGNKPASEQSPENFSELGKMTQFNQDELQHLYEEFKKDYPAGKLTREHFQRMYAKHFPRGDATVFTDHVFQNFDTDRDNTISFRELMCGMSVLMKGSTDDKLAWNFSLFDIDDSGFISKSEMTELLKSIDMMSGATSESQGPKLGSSAENRTSRVFAHADSNMDGQLSRREFFSAAKRDPAMMSMLSSVM